MTSRFHPSYEALVAKAEASHERNRSPEGITDEDIGLARLYCYAFRLHTIGTFHATGAIVRPEGAPSAESEAWRLRAREALKDLANQAMEPVPNDFRAVVSTLHRYHRLTQRVIDSLERDYTASRDAQMMETGRRFAAIVGKITGGNGIHLTQDTEAPEQASFVVPNLGIVIVPLVYGDHHSWNLAWLAGKVTHVPTHLHHHGVEIHLGYNPTHGITVLGNHRADVDEGYAMPIPPDTAHGWVNAGSSVHHVPFIFGSLKHSGWGVFLDVEPVTDPVERLADVPRESAPFRQMIYLEREIASAARLAGNRRTTLIPYSVTHRKGSGGLELELLRANASGLTMPADVFRAVSVVRGRGRVSIDGVETEVAAHDHFAVPAGMTVTMAQNGAEPFVALNATIRGVPGRG